MDESKKEKDPHEVEIINNKDKYISLNENTENAKDITNDIISKLKEMKEGQMICTDNFSLQGTMSGIELNHIKMDFHYHNENVKTYRTFLREGKIKTIEDLTIDESLIIINELFRREVSWFHGGVLQQDIFSFIYLSDPLYDQYTLNEIKISLVKAYIDSIFHLIYISYSKYSDWTCLREEDCSFIYFTNIAYLKRDNCINDIKNIEIYLRKEKNEENKKIINQLLNRFKIQRILILMITEQFDKTNSNRFKNLVIYMNDLREEINIIDFSIENKQSNFTINNYFNIDIAKILPSLTSNKYKRILTSEETIKKLNHFVNSLNSLCVIYTRNNYYHLTNEIIKFSSHSESFILKLFLDINLFSSNNFLFDTFDLKDSINQTLKKLKIDITDDDTLSYLLSTKKDVLKSKLKNKARQLRESNELINNLTAIAFYCHRKETELSPNGKITKSSLTNYALKTVLHEMHYIVQTSFSLELFQPYELDFVFFVCEVIVSQLSMHNFVLATRYADKIIKSDNMAAHTSKKKFSQYQKMLLDEIYIYDALKKAYSALKFLFVYLKEKEMIKVPKGREKEEELRCEKRFPYFKVISAFLNISYKSFKEDVLKGKEENVLVKQSENAKLGIKGINELKSAEQKLRDIHSFDNDYLTNLSKAIMANCLAIGKVGKLEKDKKKFVEVLINMKKYNTFMPVIELK